MQRTIPWTLLLTMILTFTGPTDDHRASGQALDPIPLDDEGTYESDLPAPPQEAAAADEPKDYSQAYLGVTFDPQVRNAVVARSVSAGSPADQAGVRAGDTIDSVNGRRVSSYQEVLDIVNRLRPGEVLDIDISRRISVRARAVLDGQPIGSKHSVLYPPAVVLEPLPTPATYQPRARQIVPPNSANSYRQNNANNYRQRPNASSPNSRSNDRDRGNRNRGRLPRRRD